MTQAVLLEPQMRSTSAFMDGSLAPLSTSLAIESPPGSPVSPVSMPEHRSNVAPREIMSSQTLETPKWLAYLAIPTRNSQISILEETNTNSDRLSNPEIKHNEARDYSEPKTRLELSDASTYDLAGMHQLQNHVLDKGTDQQSKPTPLKPLLSTTVDTAVRDTRNPVACQTKIRTRNNKTQPGANNRYGRRGNLSCHQCRKRRSKCIYISEWLPCEFCRSRNINAPCLKLRGPKTAARLLEPSRPIPTADSAIINAEDALLLAYAYADKKQFSPRSAWFRLVSTQYGPAISSPSLRHVILAITASELPKVSFAARAQYHKQRAVAVLIQKLQNSATIQEADVSAAMLLAEFAYDSHRWSEVVIHMEGFISMMKLGNGTGETALHRFAPLVAMTKDSESFCNAVWFLLGVSPGHPSFGSQLALFRHRRCYWDTLRPFCLLSETSQAPISLLGLIDALEDVLVLSICCIRRIAAEDGPNYLEPLSAVEECLNHNDAELQELQSTVQSLKNSERISSKIDVEMHLRLTTLALPLTQCIQLARILKSPDGLGSPEAASMATLMLSSVRSRVLNEKSFDYHSDQLWFGHALLLAGLTLPREDVEKFDDWIYEKLNRLGLRREADALRKYWETRTSDMVAEIFDTVLVA